MVLDPKVLGLVPRENDIRKADELEKYIDDQLKQKFPDKENLDISHIDIYIPLHYFERFLLAGSDYCLQNT